MGDHADSDGGHVLTALRMALTYDPDRGPFGAVPARTRIDRGLEFAARALEDALAALVVDQHRLPGFTPYRKGKIERIHLTIKQTLPAGTVQVGQSWRSAAATRVVISTPGTLAELSVGTS
jgi:transposase InsO family protein